MTHPSSHTPPRGIDHLVIAAADLSALAARYRALGFTVGPRNRHPWGTENHIVQVNGAFMELIGIGDASLIPPPSARTYSFGAAVQNAVQAGGGLAMLALESRNAVADAEEFRRHRIGDFEPFYFERTGQGDDGQPRRVSFTLAFAHCAAAPHAGFFTCQQHQPQNFWNAAMQRHANGVTGVRSVVMVADDPADMHEFLGAFIGQREMRSTSFGLEIDTGRGLIEVLTEQAFAFRFGCAAPGVAGQGGRFAAFVLSSPQPPGAPRVIPAAEAGGVVLAFAE